MHTLKTWVKLCKDMKKLSLYQSCLIDKFRKSYKTLLVIALFFPENINNDNNKNEKKIMKWKKDNKVSLKQQQKYLRAPFDNLKRVSTTLCEEFFSISMEIRKRFDKKILKTNFIPSGLKAHIFVKKRLWRSLFFVNVTKFLRRPFLQNTSGNWFLSYIKFPWCDQGCLLNKCCTSDKIWKRHLLLLWDTMPIPISIPCAEVFEKKKGVIGFFAQKILERLIYILIFFQLFAFNLKQLGKMFFNRETANQIRSFKKN